MMFIFLLQLGLPLLFIAWLAIAPSKSKLGFFVQIFGIAAALLGLALTGLWLFPPWWTSYAFAGLWVTAVFFGWRRRLPFASLLPVCRVAWTFSAVFTALGGWGVYQSLNALAGRAPQADAMVELAFPLKDGEYLVVNGGSNLSVNQHLMTLDTSIPRFHAYHGQSYGVDIVKLDAWGLRAAGLQPTQPATYDIYGETVYAPCAGQVVAAQDGLPDMQVPQVDREHMAGNHVLLRRKDADVLLGHFKPGSLSVKVGDQVTVGSRVAEVGNTGNTGEPHLHIDAQRAGTSGEPFSGDPLPIRLMGRFLVRNDRVSVPK